VAGYSVIADVSETLKAAIDASLDTLDPANPPAAVISDFADNISRNPASMVLFLYEVAQDPITRNRPLLREEVPNGVRLTKPPLPLVLRYLLTPFAGDRVTEQRMLARTMQALYDRPIKLGADLVGDAAPLGLAGSTASLKLHLAMLTLEERTRVWSSIQRPYRLSVIYEVRLIELDALDQQLAATVRARRLDVELGT
jgi:Pvc16 N-terminal domain